MGSWARKEVQPWGVVAWAMEQRSSRTSPAAETPTLGIKEECIRVYRCRFSVSICRIQPRREYSTPSWKDSAHQRGSAIRICPNVIDEVFSRDESQELFGWSPVSILSFMSISEELVMHLALIMQNVDPT